MKLNLRAVLTVNLGHGGYPYLKDKQQVYAC